MKLYSCGILDPQKDESFRDYTQRVHTFVKQHCPEALAHCEWAGGLSPFMTEGDCCTPSLPAYWRDLMPCVYIRQGVESPIVEVEFRSSRNSENQYCCRVWSAKTFNDTATLTLLTHLTAAYNQLGVHPTILKLLNPINHT